MKNWTNFALILGAIWAGYQFWYLPSQQLQQANPSVTLPPNAAIPGGTVQPLSTALANAAGQGTAASLPPASWATYMAQLILQTPLTAAQLATAFPSGGTVTAQAFVAGIIAAGMTPQTGGAYGLSGRIF